MKIQQTNPVIPACFFPQVKMTMKPKTPSGKRWGELKHGRRIWLKASRTWRHVHLHVSFSSKSIISPPKKRWWLSSDIDLRVSHRTRFHCWLQTRQRWWETSLNDFMPEMFAPGSRVKILYISLSSASTIPSPSSCLYADPDHLKKMSKSVPSFLQKEVNPPAHVSVL